MKTSRDAMSMADAIKNYIKKTGKEKGFQNAEIVSAWPEVMGQAVASRTEKISFYKGTLYIKLNSAPLKNELVLSRAQVAARLNEHLGETIVMNINIG
ncbi:MAG: DUF721 domain-containing protein [Flavobacteriales bacterium]|nr:DUF721 domain-containing protein [Flavobacteriales bacterium]